MSTQQSILAGAVIIAIAVLISGGVINLDKFGMTKGIQTTATPVPTLPKTAADIVANLKTYASKFGLNSDDFDKCLDSGSKAALVAVDLVDGEKAAVAATPSFFINGRILEGAYPFADFKKIIDEELSGTAPATTVRKTVDVGNLPIVGNMNAPVTIVEFSDYQCPFCERHFTQTESQIKKEYIDTGKVKLYYRDFPLTQIHPGAQKGAEAVRCAGDQNKYWQFHDFVFQNQSNIF